jgi:hypothetical protein
MAQNILIARVKNTSPQTSHKFKNEATFDKLVLMLSNEFMIPVEVVKENIYLETGAKLDETNYIEFSKSDSRLVELDIYDYMNEGKEHSDSSEEDDDFAFENKELIKLLGEIEEQGIDQYGTNPHLELDDDL